MDSRVWILLGVLVVAAASLTVLFTLKSGADAALSKERVAAAAARTDLDLLRAQMEERVRKTGEAARRNALDEFIRAIRVEERSHMREAKSMFATRRLMVVQERLFFRDVPLSNWVEHEVVLEDGSDPQRLVNSTSVFKPAILAAQKAALEQPDVNLARPVSS